MVNLLVSIHSITGLCPQEAVHWCGTKADGFCFNDIYFEIQSNSLGKKLQELIGLIRKKMHNLPNKELLIFVRRILILLMFSEWTKKYL